MYISSPPHMWNLWSRYSNQEAVAHLAKHPMAQSIEDILVLVRIVRSSTASPHDLAPACRKKSQGSWVSCLSTKILNSNRQYLTVLELERTAFWNVVCKGWIIKIRIFPKRNLHHHATSCCVEVCTRSDNQTQTKDQRTYERDSCTIASRLWLEQSQC